MTREWQPGDVALIEVDGRTGRAMRQWPGSDGLWTSAERLLGDYDHSDNDATVVRPLAVIDPEDREQVERLSEMVADEIVRNGLKSRDAMQAALREYANPTPPKPEEPQGLGAVVESEDGRRWVRSKDTTTVCHWKPAAGGRRVRWSDLPAVRVLSEAVQP